MQLSASASIDLQLHTIYSDGKWTPEDLLDYLINAGFGLAAITDHDRADTIVSLQSLATERQFPLLVAIEMSGFWHGNLTDFLCFGFDPHHNALSALAQDVLQRQQANSKQIYDNLVSAGFDLPQAWFDSLMTKPSSQHLNEWIAIVSKQLKTGDSLGKTLLGAGFTYCTHSPVTIVQATHASNGVCILAHPGRQDGFVCYDENLLDDLRAEAPIDGIECYYPLHTTEQTSLYLNYANQHNLLVSSGSDSHGIDNPPIKYPAEYSKTLLERLGIIVN